MSTGVFIAKRLIKERRHGAAFSRPINVIAITGIALGLAVMILAVSILTGFKQQIRDKVAGFGAHIQVVNFDANISYETVPISANQPFIQNLDGNQGIRNIQVFANLSAKILFDIWVSWNRRHFARTYVLIQRVSATFPYQMAIILLKIFDEFVSFHYRLKESV